VIAVIPVAVKENEKSFRMKGLFFGKLNSLALLYLWLTDWFFYNAKRRRKTRYKQNLS